MLTWVAIVADGEVRCDIAANVCKTGRAAVLSDASNLGRANPDDLREVAPVLKVGHVRLSLTVETVVPVDLAVVEEVGNDGRDVAGLDTCGDVLAIATGALGHVVSVDAAGSDLSSSLLEVAVPNESRGGMVGAVDIVVNQDSLLVGGRLGGGGGGRGSLGASLRGGWRGRAGGL